MQTGSPLPPERSEERHRRASLWLACVTAGAGLLGAVAALVTAVRG